MRKFLVTHCVGTSPAGPIVMSACPSFLISFVALWFVETRKEGLKSYADMTIYAIDPARLVPAMCHHKLPTAIFFYF